MSRLLPFVFLLLLLLACSASTEKVHLGMDINTEKVESQPLRVGVVGLVHTHVHWILGREDRGDIQIVGIVEPNKELAERYSVQHGFSMDIVFPTIEEMADKTKLEAVTAFNTTFDHLALVEYCAPRGIHVMVEKPLAVSLAHAEKMVSLAQEHGIQLLTNYETSWYGSNYAAYDILQDSDSIGDVRRIVFHTGHQGPQEIGVNQEFLEWLTDPILNGGGALMDFGCYGANLATWYLGGMAPVTVSAVTQQIKPEIYPRVDDEATIVLTYPTTQVIIQASWNWSHNRKDMEIYGTHGYIICHDREKMTLMSNDNTQSYVAPSLETGYDDPFAYLAYVVRSEAQVPPFSPSSLENNLLVMKILEAAKHSSQSGKTVIWNEHFDVIKK